MHTVKSTTEEVLSGKLLKVYLQINSSLTFVIAIYVAHTTPYVYYTINALKCKNLPAF